MKLDKKNPAWMILTDDEKLALRLNLGMQKSTWKSGEIMKKSHYKLIEIKDRARTFVRIFTHHFREYTTLIPDDAKVSADLRDYLRFTIEERLPINQAVKKVDNPLYRHMASRDKIISEEVSKWKSSKNISERELYNLVLEFDRWNNFRILPKSIQEPSAFKRRDKNRLKKHLKIGTSLSKLAFKIIKSRYSYTSRRKINDAYLCLITLQNDKGKRKVEVIRIKADKESIDELSRVSLYLFPSESLADKYLELIKTFIDKENRHCAEGLKFWPLYRDIIKKAINYNEIQNIIPSRKNLEFAERLKAERKYY